MKSSGLTSAAAGRFTAGRCCCAAAGNCRLSAWASRRKKEYEKKTPTNLHYEIKNKENVRPRPINNTISVGL
jgi:hypothetical protein